MTVSEETLEGVDLEITGLSTIKVMFSAVIKLDSCDFSPR